MIYNRSAPPGPVVPRLIYNDVAKAIDWLCGAFGFTERLRTAPDPDGVIHHAQLAVGQGSVMLTGSARPGSERSTAPAAPPAANHFIQSLFIPVADVDAHFAHAEQFGAQILQAPATHPFGERQYSAEDLEGHHWTFSQSLADANPEDWGAAVSEIRSPLELLPRPRWCYVEIPAINVRQSVAFYESVFGWNIRHRDTDRPSFDDATGSVSGTWVSGRQSANAPGLLPYIWVDSIGATLDRVREQGGQIIEPPHLDSPGGEWIATFHDPAGNVIGLYQEGGH